MAVGRLVFRIEGGQAKGAKPGSPIRRKLVAILFPHPRCCSLSMRDAVSLSQRHLRGMPPTPATNRTIALRRGVMHMTSLATALRTAADQFPKQVDETAESEQIRGPHRVLSHAWRPRRPIVVLGGQSVLTTFAYIFSAAFLSEVYGRDWTWRI